MRSYRLATVFILPALAFLSACGPRPQEYVDKVGPALLAYANSLTAFQTEMDKLAADASLFEDAAWQSDTKSALDNLDQAAQTLGGIPAEEVPDAYQQVDLYLKRIAQETTGLKESLNRAIDNQSVDEFNASSIYVDNINTLVDQVNTATNQ